VNGPFVTLESLLEVSGIGPAKFAQFKEKIRL
jgi:competence protein ComEA